MSEYNLCNVTAHRIGWLYRINININEFRQESKGIPKFGFYVAEGCYLTNDFDVDFIEFVDGMFAGRLNWRPKGGEVLQGYAYYKSSICLKCGGINRYVCALEMYTPSGIYVSGDLFGTYIQAKEVIENYIPKARLLECDIGSLDHIYN
ncbi:hypothetical protein AB6D92_18510 [Vibrio splendidus]